jgi:carbon-monoxide dehydrogenase small subunit
MKNRDISINVNGRVITKNVEPRLLLVHFLRDVIGLTGTHIGCETSLCGACTVLLRLPGEATGRAAKSCTVLAVQADGSAVTTVEGLAQNKDGESALSAVQQGFWEEHGLQCGYCTPGMIMNATDLLQRSSEPSDQEIRAALGGNICRCTGYQNIVAAVRNAAGKLNAGKTNARKAAAGARANGSPARTVLGASTRGR